METWCTVYISTSKNSSTDDDDSDNNNTITTKSKNGPSNDYYKYLTLSFRHLRESINSKSEIDDKYEWVNIQNQIHFQHYYWVI